MGGVTRGLKKRDKNNSVFKYSLASLFGLFVGLVHFVPRPLCASKPATQRKNSRKKREKID